MTAPRRTRPAIRFAQAWVELRAEDPEAVSALAVARSRLAAGRELRGLRRLRLIELRGAIPTRPRLERLLHGSIQFYNPHKERCVVRTTARDRGPAEAGQSIVLVTERNGERKPAAERWWFHETGEGIEVREGTAWVLELVPGAEHDLEALITVRDRQQGLLCNPHSQDSRSTAGRVPLPWFSPAATPQEE